jgi:hypothetical protein
MKRHLSMIIGCLLMGFAAAAAWAEPIGRSVEISRPFNAVYDSLSTYFSPDSMHDFQVLTESKSKSAGEIVAKRTITDPVKWRELTYCKVPALQMLDTLKEGDVTVTVKVNSAGSNSTYVTVTPDFEGNYEFAGSSHTQQCQSNGELEKDILLGAGAAETDLH